MHFFSTLFVVAPFTSAMLFMPAAIKIVALIHLTKIVRAVSEQLLRNSQFQCQFCLLT